MAPVAKQLHVMRRLTAHLEGINPGAEDPAYTLVGEEPQNYAVDLRGKVFRGRTTIGAEVVMPALSLLESPTPVAALHAGEEGHRKAEDWRVLLQGFADDDKQNPLDPAYALKAAVEARLQRVIDMKQGTGTPTHPDEYLLGGLLVGMVIGQGVVRPPEEKVSRTAFFYIPLVLRIATTTKNPYVAA